MGHVIRKIEDFKQIKPTPEDAKEHGRWGWGFETDNGLRIVMHCEAKDDDKDVQQNGRHGFYQQQAVSTEAVADDDRDDEYATHINGFDEKDDSRKKRREIKRDEKKAAKLERKGDHAPAHVHVIEIETGRESKFELIENTKGAHFVQLYNPSFNGNGSVEESKKQKKKKKKTKKRELSTDRISEVIPLLNDHAEQFIHLWREFYTDKDLFDSYVTRVSEACPDALERMSEDSNKKKKRYTNKDGGYVIIEDPIGHIEKRSFRNYLSLIEYRKKASEITK